MNAGNNEWVFGKFEDDECVEVIDGGTGVPSEDIGRVFRLKDNWLEKYRLAQHQANENFIDSLTSRINLNLDDLVNLAIAHKDA